MGLQTALTLDDIVSRTNDLPSISPAALAVMHEVDGQDPKAERVAFHLSTDPSLAVTVLRLANSAFYGMPKRVSNIQQAVMILGMRAVRNLALVASTYPFMSQPMNGYALGPGQLWEHCLGTAVASGLVAEQCGKVTSEQGFTGGLLHDIGKLAMNMWLDRKMPALIRIAEIEGSTFDAVERRVFGYDHTEVGAFLGEKWNLPPDLTVPMRWHHRPDMCVPNRPLVDVIHVGDYMAMSMGLGVGGDGLRYEVSENALQRLGLLPDDLIVMADLLITRYERQAKALKEVMR